MIEICKVEECTGCSTCRDVCPRHCITMVADEMDACHPLIDNDLCINCKRCINSCPNNRKLDYNYPQKVWVAWSRDTKVRLTSASGGLAYELYRYWLSTGGVAAGVVYDHREGCHFVLIENLQILADIQNSKYTFSDTSGIYKVVKDKLSADVPVLFIGVPCQIAGLYGFLKKDYANLVTIDIICHGMPPAAYLEQHISRIEKRKNEHAIKLFFRDPRFHTYTYTFTLYSPTLKLFYKKKVLGTDNYQLGYHRALIYRENCYQCRHARNERIGDLTLGDFSGLGKIAAYEGDIHNVSCVLQNTDKGAFLLSELGNKIYKEERPMDEAFIYESQLQRPSVKHPSRKVFEAEYKRTKDFERAADASLMHDKIIALITELVCGIKNVIREILPDRIISLIRNLAAR